MDDNTNARLDELREDYVRLAERNRQSIQSLRRSAVWSITFVLLVLFVLGGATFYLRGQDAERAKEAKRLSLAIQQSRATSIRSTCESDNQRHDKLTRLLAESRARAKTKTQRAQLDLFVDAVAHKQDCEKLVRELTRVPVS